MTIAMEYRDLGDTGIRVSAIGLGTGGASRLGLRSGSSLSKAIEVAEAAVSCGVTLIDTAPGYGTEEVVGALLTHVPRDALVVSSKVPVRDAQGSRSTRRDVRTSLERTLDAIGSDRIDLLLLHGVRPEDYEHCHGSLLPELVALRDQGLVGAVGLSESYQRDPHHHVLRRTLEDPAWDVAMVGANLLDPSAASLVREHPRRLGTVAMHAVRWALSATDRLAAHLERTAAEEVDASEAVADAARMLRSGRWDGLLPAAAYSFALGLPSVASVLTGTGSLEHLNDNVQALSAPADERATEFLDVMRGLLTGSPASAGEPPCRDLARVDPARPGTDDLGGPA